MWKKVCFYCFIGIFIIQTVLISLVMYWLLNKKASILIKFEKGVDETKAITMLMDMHNKITFSNPDNYQPDQWVVGIETNPIQAFLWQKRIEEMEDVQYIFMSVGM